MKYLKWSLVGAVGCLLIPFVILGTILALVASAVLAGWRMAGDLLDVLCDWAEV